MKTKLNLSVRADVVGSLLRPERLLITQEKEKLGKTEKGELTAVEDQAVRDAVTLQEKIGMDIITDGEMRRPVFCHNFVSAVDGFAWDIPGNTVIWFDMNGKKVVDPVTVGVVGRLKQIHDISVGEFSFVRALAHTPVKITIPSPTMMTYYFVPGISDSVYPNPMRFLDEVTQILTSAVDQLERMGAACIQIDAPEFGMLLDPIQREWFGKKGFNPDTLVSEGVKRINRILKNFSGLKALHICRGNDKNRFMARGGYERFAPVLFGETEVDRLLLEFDSDRAGDFTPLRFVPKDKTVALGLITTKSPHLETPSSVVQRIHEAAEFVSFERLAISTQCGFASVAKGNNMTLPDQVKKLRLVKRIARQVWHE